MAAEVRESLEELRERTHADTLSEVIRRALAVYDALITERERGGSPVVRYEDGRERELLLI